ncbi:ABC transporter ATP-binding protein [Alteribacillus sp. YIM 98480]|uniref:ABC transporter ATP-binding protein n=1 Tax=Alteribacillus sp. YIM 98480 TaxID=2606599 RepID=UPI002715280D|nr:ABC transporter ATP-binding protein [Alteribacillus sp. YIM 98480]
MRGVYMKNEPLLEVNGLKTYITLENKKQAKAVDGVDFVIHKGETTALVGESGSGKSMTSMSIMRLIPEPSGKIVEGSIKLEGKELLKLSEKQMEKVRGNEIGMIFQDPHSSLNPVFTIGMQIAEPLRKHKKMKKKEAYKKAVELLVMAGLPNADQIVKMYPHQLSGGMVQRVVIAIAMSCDPKLIIADEPTTALDVTIQSQILGLMTELKDQTNSAVLMITHDIGVVSEAADKVMVMYGGQIVEKASVKELFRNPKHPYTIGLLASVPRIEVEQERLESIQGTVPPSHAFPKGCRFAPRCKHAIEACTKTVPELIESSNDHEVRCILYRGEETRPCDNHEQRNTN